MSIVAGLTMTANKSIIIIIELNFSKVLDFRTTWHFWTIVAEKLNPRIMFLLKMFSLEVVLLKEFQIF